MPIRRLLPLCSFVLLAQLADCRAASAALAPPQAVKNLTAWYDVSDDSTMTTQATVAQLLDKSGNGYSLEQPTNGSQPAYAPGTLNGLPTLTFNGTSDYLYGRNGFPTGSDYTIIWVGKFSSAASANNLLSAYNIGAGSGGGHAFFGNYGTTPALYQGTPFAVSPSQGTAPFMSVATYSTATNLGSIYNNGNSVPATGTGPSRPVMDPSLEIGGLGGGGYYLTGSFGEAIVFKSVLTTLQRQMIEGVLACKWGLQNQLPGDHPYKRSCPAGSEAETLKATGSLNAWYDASDINSVTFQKNVSQLSDKSGNNNTLKQPTIASEPNLTLIGSNQALMFNGGQYLSSGPVNTFATGSNPSSIFVVGTYTGLKGSTFALAAAYGGSGTGELRGIGKTRFTAQPYITEGNSDLHSFNYWSSKRPTIAYASFGSTHEELEIDGDDVQTRNVVPNTPPSTSFNLGMQAGGLQWWTGPIYETLVYNRTLSIPERQFIEGYLACKYGIQNVLPADHPYAKVCPGSGTASLTLDQTAQPAGNQGSRSDVTVTTSFKNTSGTLVYNPVLTAEVPSNSEFQIGSTASKLAGTGLQAITAYSNDHGSSYSYEPVSGGGGAPAGYDRNVTNVQWRLNGALGTAPPANAGTMSFTVKKQ